MGGQQSRDCCTSAMYLYELIRNMYTIAYCPILDQVVLEHVLALVICPGFETKTSTVTADKQQLHCCKPTMFHSAISIRVGVVIQLGVFHIMFHIWFRSAHAWHAWQ